MNRQLSLVIAATIAAAALGSSTGAPSARAVFNDPSCTLSTSAAAMEVVPGRASSVTATIATADQGQLFYLEVVWYVNGAFEYSIPGGAKVADVQQGALYTATWTLTFSDGSVPADFADGPNIVYTVEAHHYIAGGTDVCQPGALTVHALVPGKGFGWSRFNGSGGSYDSGSVCGTSGLVQLVFTLYDENGIPLNGRIAFSTTSDASTLVVDCWYPYQPPVPLTATALGYANYQSEFSVPCGLCVENKVVQVGIYLTTTNDPTFTIKVPVQDQQYSTFPDNLTFNARRLPANGPGNGMVSVINANLAPAGYIRGGCSGGVSGGPFPSGVDSQGQLFCTHYEGAVTLCLTSYDDTSLETSSALTCTDFQFVPAVDSDGDGVPDASDNCPDTAPGDPVDASGCSKAQVDADADGVCDPGKASDVWCTGSDNCPATPLAELVDANGCSQPQLKPLLAEKFSPVLLTADGDYEPEEVQIFLDEAGRPNCRTQLLHHTLIGPDRPLANCPTAQTLVAIENDRSDYIDITGIEVGDEEGYRSQYAALASTYNLVTYADVTLTETEVWIDYWFFYYYDDFFAWDHEGDWERISVHIPASWRSAYLTTPDAAWYSQHLCDRRRDVRQFLADRAWSGVAKLGTRPVAYVARGSHANYFDNGMRGFHLVTGCGVYDRTFVRAVGLAPAVVAIDCDRPAAGQEWLGYVGRWGQWAGGPHGPCR